MPVQSHQMQARIHTQVQAMSQGIAETFQFLAETFSFLSSVPETPGQRLCLHCNSHVDFGVVSACVARMDQL